MTKKGKFQLIILVGGVFIATFALYKTTEKPTPLAINSDLVGEINTHIDQNAMPSDEACMVVFVHGSITHMVRRLNIETIIGIARDKIEGTLYEKATEHMRQNPFFRRDQAMQGLGLQPIDKSAILPGKAATALANIFDQIDMWTSGKNPAHTYYYTFGWDALVSETIRARNAQKFYQELFDEINRLKAAGYKTVLLKILGFSHGGTVTVALANVHYVKPISDRISVDELVLIGTPLHIGMYDQICSPLFKKIYNIYSPKDRAQRLDLTTPGFLSQHVFVAPKGKQLPDKLTQIQLSITRNRTTKRHWDHEKDPRYNFDLPSIVTGSSDLFRRASPTHVELWFFEWAVCGYRDSFSLRPLPTVAAVPIILDAVKKHVDVAQRHFHVDVRPDQELFLIKTEQGHTVVPLLTHNQFNELKLMAYAYEVKQHPKLEYNDQANLAIIWAEQERKLRKINQELDQALHAATQSTVPQT